MGETADVLPAVYQSIPVDQIRPAAHQARKTFDEASLRALADSIKEEGLLQAITVRPAGEGYELISGERRLRAAKILGWATMNARIIQTVSEGEAAAKGLVENLQRQDLNPIEEGIGFQTLNQLDPLYWTHDKISQIAGRSRVYITQSLGFLNLHEEVKSNVSQLTLSRSHALELMRLPMDKQVEVSKQVISRDLSPKETRKLVDTVLGNTSKAVAPAGSKPVSISNNQDPLKEMWVKIQGRTTSLEAKWEVDYPQHETWTFTAKPNGGSYADFLAGWFETMAKAIKAHDPLNDSEPEEDPAVELQTTAQ